MYRSGRPACERSAFHLPGKSKGHRQHLPVNFVLLNSPPQTFCFVITTCNFNDILTIRTRLALHYIITCFVFVFSSTWTLFVDCTKRYTEHCFEESKRKVFNKAVENSIELVHQMCTSPQYQTGC